MAKTYKLNSATAKQTLTYAASLALKADNAVNIFNVAMTGALTVTVDSASKSLVPGTRIILIAASDGTARDVTFGTGFTCPVLAGVISKTKVQELIYDGSTFVATGAPLQLN